MRTRLAYDTSRMRTRTVPKSLVTFKSKRFITKSIYLLCFIPVRQLNNVYLLYMSTVIVIKEEVVKRLSVEKERAYQ